MMARGRSIQIPSQEDVQSDFVYHMDSFDNQIPGTDERRHTRPLTRSAQRDLDPPSHPETAGDQPTSLLSTLIWPAFAICVPIALLSAALLVLVFVYQIIPEEDLFRPSTTPVPYIKQPYILVNFSATRLVFVASFLSTLAPILAAFVMSLYALIVSRNLRQASQGNEFEKLPTPFQMSLLIGNLVASTEQLRNYFGYLLSRKRTARIPPVLHRAAAIFTFSLLMAGAVFIADTFLHYLTFTIEFDQITQISAPTHQLGYGLSETCLTFDRTALYGWPCSVAIGWDDPNYVEEENEAVRLLLNISSLSEIRYATYDATTGQDMAYLIPQVQSLPSPVDFRATTIGVSTQCQFVSPTACDMHQWGPLNAYTDFNCTDSFWGTLGKSQNQTDTQNTRQPDAYRSYLAFKPASNIQYNFFSDKALETIYNTAGLNDTGQLDPNINPWDDSALVNPFYMAFAGRSAVSGFLPDSETVTSDQIYHPDTTVGYLDYVLNCAVSSYEVDFTWVQGQLQNMSTSPTKNGSVLEIFHGAVGYTSITGGGSDLQEYMQQASLAGNTTASFLAEFGNLYSVKVLSKIGAYTTPRMALQQQERTHLLLAKVPKPALGALIGCSLLYSVVGLVLFVRAYRAARGNIRDIATQLSLAGLSAAAFDSKDLTETQGAGDSQSSLQALSRRETRRVVVDGSPQKGFEFRVWV